MLILVFRQLSHANRDVRLAGSNLKTQMCVFIFSWSVFMNTFSYRWIPFNAARWTFERSGGPRQGSDIDQDAPELKPLLE